MSRGDVILFGGPEAANKQAHRGGHMSGKWVFVSDGDPNSGCGCLLVIAVGLLLVYGGGCR